MPGATGCKILLEIVFKGRYPGFRHDPYSLSLRSLTIFGFPASFRFLKPFCPPPSSNKH